MTKEELKAELNIRFNEILIAGYGSEETATPLNRLLLAHRPLVTEIMTEDYHLRTKGMAVGSVLLRSAVYDHDNRVGVPPLKTISPNAN